MKCDAKNSFSASITFCAQVCPCGIRGEHQRAQPSLSHNGLPDEEHHDAVQRAKNWTRSSVRGFWFQSPHRLFSQLITFIVLSFIRRSVRTVFIAIPLPAGCTVLAPHLPISLLLLTFGGAFRLPSAPSARLFPPPPSTLPRPPPIHSRFCFSPIQAHTTI